jgi:hypothetical protein
MPTGCCKSVGATDDRITHRDLKAYDEDSGSDSQFEMGESTQAAADQNLAEDRQAAADQNLAEDTDAAADQNENDDDSDEEFTGPFWKKLRILIEDGNAKHRSIMEAISDFPDDPDANIYLPDSLVEELHGWEHEQDDPVPTIYLLDSLEEG